MITQLRFTICFISLLAFSLQGMERVKLELRADGTVDDPDFYKLSSSDQDYMMRIMMEFKRLNDQKKRLEDEQKSLKQELSTMELAYAAKKLEEIEGKK